MLLVIAIVICNTVLLYCCIIISTYTHIAATTSVLWMCCKDLEILDTAINKCSSSPPSKLLCHLELKLIITRVQVSKKTDHKAGLITREGVKGTTIKVIV